MRQYTITQIVRNVVEKQGGTLYKMGSIWNIDGVSDIDFIFNVIKNIVPSDYKVQTGVSISNKKWLMVWPGLTMAHEPSVYEFSQ